MAWFFSHKPFCHGDSAAVVLWIIFNLAVASAISSLLNSPPLSVKNLVGVPKILIHFSITASITSSGFFLGIILATVNLEKASMMYRMCFPLLSFLRSIATVSLISLAIDRATAGRSGFLFLSIHPSHASIILSSMLLNEGFHASAFFRTSMKACFGLWPNCLWIFCSCLY